MFEIAVLLEHNRRGERYAADAHLDEAISIYRQLRAQFRIDRADSNLLAALLHRERFDEVVELAREMPQSTSRDLLWVSATAIRQGGEAAVAQAASLVSDPATRRAVLAGATLKCMQLGRYPAARQLFGAISTKGNIPASREFEKFDTFLARLKPRSEWGVAPNDPRIAPLRLFEALLSDSPAPIDPKSLFADELGPFLPETFFDEQRKAVAATLAPTGLLGAAFPRAVRLDMTVAALDFSVTGGPRLGWRVRATALGTDRPADFFVVLQGEDPRLLGMSVSGMPTLFWGLGVRAQALVDRGDADAARQWIAWARETIAAGGGESWKAFLDQSQPAAVSTEHGLRQAAVLLAAKRGGDIPRGDVPLPSPPLGAASQTAPLPEHPSLSFLGKSPLAWRNPLTAKGQSVEPPGCVPANLSVGLQGPVSSAEQEATPNATSLCLTSGNNGVSFSFLARINGKKTQFYSPGLSSSPGASPNEYMLLTTDEEKVRWELSLKARTVTACVTGGPVSSRVCAIVPQASDRLLEWMAAGAHVPPPERTAPNEKGATAQPPSSVHQERNPEP